MLVQYISGSGTGSAKLLDTTPTTPLPVYLASGSINVGSMSVTGSEVARLQYTDGGGNPAFVTPAAPLPTSYPASKQYAISRVLSNSGAIELAGPTGCTASFQGNVTDIIVTYCDKAMWIAKTSASVQTVASGALDGRIYIPAGAMGMDFPWSGSNVWITNANTGEMPTIYLAGFGA